MSDFPGVPRCDITIIAGDTFAFWFGFELPDGSVEDPPEVGDGYTIGRMTVRDTYGGTELLTLDTDNGGVTLGLTTDAAGEEWSGYATASATTTSALVEWGDGVYDLKISDGLHVKTRLWGLVNLAPVATESMP